MTTFLFNKLSNLIFMQQVTQYDFFVACVDEYIEQKIIAKLLLKGFGVPEIKKM